MGRVSWLAVTLTFVFDIIAFGLALGAMARRSQASAVITTGGFYCQYTRDTSTGLSIAACIFLLIGQVIVSAVTRCLCCGGATYKPSAGRICAIILFVFSWIAFAIAEIFLLAGASENRIQTTGVSGVDNELFCKQVRKSVFAVGATFAFLTMLCSIISYVLLVKAQVKEAAWQSYGTDPYGGNNAPTIGMTPYT